MKAIQIKRDETDFDQVLREEYGDVNICGHSYVAVEAFECLDPKQYKQELESWQVDNMQWKCGKCNKVYNDKDDAQDCCENI